MKELLETQKRDTESQIASLKDQIATLNKPSSPPPPPAQEDTPKPGPAPSITEAPRRVFKVNELVSARYAADRQWYPATIVSVQGSSAAPIYTVTFKGYTGNETIRGNDIRPINPPSASSQKRKAETIPSSNPAPPPPPAAPFNNGTVFSAPPAIDSALAEALRNGDGKPSIADGADKPAKRKKPRGDKSLENSKQNWQKWQTQASKGKIAKVANKESMFKLSDKPGARGQYIVAGRLICNDCY